MHLIMFIKKSIPLNSNYLNFGPMKKVLLTVFTVACIIFSSTAQYVDQALIFSQQYFGSTARSKAMGNAFGALGGDFSSLSINPAGIGIYQKSEVSLSANIININNTETTYRGQSAEDKSTNFNLRNFGYVYAKPSGVNSSGLVSVNFGIGFNRLNNFNQNITTQAMNSPYSRTDAFAANSNGITSSEFFIENDPYNNVPWESKLAWETYLINVANPDTNGIGDQYVSILLPGEKVNQYETIDREGYINEYPISFGINFNHKLYFGTTIGLHDLYYKESRIYSENGDFGNFDYFNYASTRGFGYNLKLGLIYRLKSLRLGIALHTPTFYNLKESYNSVMSSDLQNVSADADGSHSESSPDGDYKYKMESPYRTILSVAYQFGKKGLISMDLEYVDYSISKLSKGSDGYNFEAENQEITNVYNSVGNLRIGGEYRATEALSLRGGFEFFGNPYNSPLPDPNDPAKLKIQPNENYSYATINLGLGYRKDNVFFDLAYSFGAKTNYTYIYHVYQNDHVFQNDNLNIRDIALPVKYDSLIHELVFTIGIKL
jgi:long-subunit fatty acid transport protein